MSLVFFIQEIGHLYFTNCIFKSHTYCSNKYIYIFKRYCISLTFIYINGIFLCLMPINIPIERFWTWIVFGPISHKTYNILLPYYLI